MATDIAEVYGPIERAHRKFSVGALQRLYPELQGAALAKAMAREMLRDAAYLENARRRLTEAVSQANALPGPMRREKLDQAKRAEMRYLKMHIEAAGHRMMREAEAARIFETEDEAYWQLGDRKTHTPDCLRMAGRVWKREVLERVNPANRHAGCGCRLRRVSEARAEGLPIRRGIETPQMRALTEVQEARRSVLGTVAATGKSRHVRSRQRIAVKFRGLVVPKFGIGKWDESKHPRDLKGQFIRVFGEIPKPLQPKFKRLTKAIAAGDLKTVERLNRELLDDARKLKKPERHKAEKTLRRVAKKTVDPSGARVDYGKRKPMGKARPGSEPEMRAVPLDAAEEQIYDGWSSEADNYLWAINPRAAQTVLANLQQQPTNDWAVEERGSMVLIQPNPNLDAAVRRAMARNAEVILPALRTARAVSPTELLMDDRPLGIGEGEFVLNDTEPTKGKAVGPNESVYAGVSNHQIGIAGELGIFDVVSSLKAMGLMAEDDDRVYLSEQDDKNPYAPLDWFINGWGIEVKSTGLRNFNFDDLNDSKPIDSEQGPRKRAAALTGKWVKYVRESNPKLTAAQRRKVELYTAKDQKGELDDARAAGNKAAVKRLEDELVALGAYKRTSKGLTAIKNAPLSRKQRRRVSDIVGHNGLIDAARKAGDHELAEKMWDELVAMKAYRKEPHTFKGGAKEVFDRSKGKEQIQGEVAAKGLKPAIVQNLVDLDNNVQHVFFYEYAHEDSAFASAPRIPVGMTRELADGTLRPGDWRSPEGGDQRGPRYRTIYVGAFPLRLNPHLEKDIGLDSKELHRIERLNALREKPRLTAAEQEERRELEKDLVNPDAEGIHARLRGPARRADTGDIKRVPPISELVDTSSGRQASGKTGGKKAAAPKVSAKNGRKRAGKRSLSDLTSDEKKLLDLHKEGLTQNQIKARMGRSQKWVSTNLSKLRDEFGEKAVPTTKQGERRDLAQQRRQGSSVAVKGAEMARRAAAVKRLWGAQRNTTPTNRKPSIAAVAKELGITREEAKAAIERATKDLEQKGVIRPR